MSFSDFLHNHIKVKITLFSVIFLLLFMPHFTYANDSQWSNSNINGFIGAYTDISQIANTYIDTSLTEPFQVFYNKGELSVGTRVEADTDLYLAYSISYGTITPNYISIGIPLTRAIFLTDTNFDIDSIYLLYNGSAYSTYTGDYDLDTSSYNYWLNLYDFNNSPWQSDNNKHYVVIVKLHLNDLLYISDSGIMITSDNHYIIDTDFVRYNTFQNISYPMYLMNNNLIKIFNDLSKISRYFASDSKLNAEEASQPVIDQALDDFTGEGSASVKVRDISSAKDVSNSLKSGLDSGGSAGEALSILSPNNSFWLGWFSQDCASYFEYIDPSEPWVEIPFIQEGQYYIYNTSGVPVYLTSYENYSRSNYIDVHLFKSIKYSRINSTRNVPYAMFVYDINKNRIATIRNITGQFWTYSEDYYNLPDNAYYIGLNLFLPEQIPGAYVYGQYRYDTNLRSKSYNPDAIPDVISVYDEEYNRYIHKEDER